jgi:hypothetical protein
MAAVDADPSQKAVAVVTLSYGQDVTMAGWLYGN